MQLSWWKTNFALIQVNSWVYVRSLFTRCRKIWETSTQKLPFIRKISFLLLQNLEFFCLLCPLQFFHKYMNFIRSGVRKRWLDFTSELKHSIRFAHEAVNWTRGLRWLRVCRCNGWLDCNFTPETPGERRNWGSRCASCEHSAMRKFSFAIGKYKATEGHPSNDFDPDAAPTVNRDTLLALCCVSAVIDERRTTNRSIRWYDLR